MMTIHQIKTQLINNPWLITQEAYITIQSAIDELSFELQEVEVEAEEPSIANDIGVLNLQGTVMRDVPPVLAKLFGIADVAVFRDQVKALADDDSVKGIMLNIDSPGGSVTGVEEAGEAVAYANSKKPVYASVEGLMASAAYWIGSQARMIVASNSSKVGSIGVYLPVVDSSESYKAQGIQVELIKNKEATYKGAGFDGTSLTKDQKDYMGEMVQDIFNSFKGAVVSARSQVKSGAMRGQSFLGKKAKEQGLVDVNGSFEEAMALLKYEIN